MQGGDDVTPRSLECALDFHFPGFVFKAACGQGKYPFFQVSGIGCPGEGSGGMVSHS